MNFFFHQLSRTLGVFFRTIRAFFSRKIMGVTSMLRRLTNFSRHATKVASSSLQGVVTAAQNPSGPSDYVETGHLYISKSLIIRVLLAIVALALIGYFVVWPFVLSRFLTAKFYEEDKRVADWSGRVIIYSDPKKTLPLYSGRLEKGVLQGEGKLYDREGVLLYEGQLKDGQRDGAGKEYEEGILVYEGQLREGLRDGSGEEYKDGALVYEGQFEVGLYSGRGKRYNKGKMVYDGQYMDGLRSGSGVAYEDGKRLYEGQFLDDLYEGRGKLYQNGTLCYDGSFHAGAAEGTGISYYSSGKIAYQGQFLADKADGIGTSYAANGQKEYSGGFAEGVYSGQGTLFFADGGQLEGNFQNGKPIGNVNWKKNGILYYQGEWSGNGPTGFGTLYSKTGKKLYEGPFLGGTIDGRGLLEYTTEELRTALGESSIKNENDGTAFRIIADELGMTALCTFQSEDTESRVYQIYLSVPEKSDWVALLPGSDHTEPVQWPEDAQLKQVKIQYVAQIGVNLPEGLYYAENAVSPARRVTALYTDESRQQSVLLTWARRDVTPDPLSKGSGGLDSKVEKLLGAMDKMIGTDGTAAGTGASFGGKKTDDAFKKITEVDAAMSAVDAMIAYWGQSQRLNALEEVLDRNEVLLQDARNAAGRGVGSQTRVESLEQQQIELQARIENCKTAIKRAELQASAAGVDGLGNYALEEMLVSFNPAEQDVSALALIATAYAQATGSEMDGDAAQSAVKEGLLNLADAHSTAKLMLARCQTLETNTKNAAGAYSMGLGSKDAWYESMNEEAMARADLCVSLADFSRLASRFNQLTGGWVSRTFDWHKTTFETLFLSAILPEEELENNAEVSEENEPSAPAETESSEPAESGTPIPEEDGAPPETDPQDPVENNTDPPAETGGDDITDDCTDCGEETAAQDPAA